MTKVILETNFPNLKLVKKGKVRDIYDLGEYYLIVATDRLSAFDVIMNQGIPLKGKILTKISEFWFNFSKNIIPNHLVSTNLNDFPSECLEYADELDGRSMMVKKAEVIPIECIVRGYISGSGWNDYLKTGKTSGIALPAGLKESDKLPEPLFTPSTKAVVGIHDENISIDEAVKIAGTEKVKALQDAVVGIYKEASGYALSKGIIIADTKMEFGMYNNSLILVDEVLTPDSSRFWPLDKYKAGQGQESYDKQFIRDYLEAIKFDKKPPAPDIPLDVIEKTKEKYLEVLYKLTGQTVVN